MDKISAISFGCWLDKGFTELTLLNAYLPTFLYLLSDKGIELQNPFTDNKNPFMKCGVNNETKDG
jgi:hypothetical protein